MPCLRQITCQIEWPETGLKFEEYGTVYGDGLVETFIAVPDKPQPLSIHLTSKGYIAEGLAMLVYIDGEYQCNRNRLHLKPPKKGQPRDQTDVDFRLRQKEKTIGGGTFIGRDWRFDCHNIVPNGQFPGDFDPTHFDQLGVIEVMVLRCRAKPGDDSGSESLTHESILGEIDNFGQPLEDLAAPDEGSGNHQPTVADAPDEAEELAGLAGVLIDGAADQPDHFRGNGAADQPHRFGLDGEAPPGYWTYHPQPPPRHEYRPENRLERRVHFDYGSPRAPYYPARAPSQQQNGPPREGYHGGPAGNGRSTWQYRPPTEYGGQSNWHAPQLAQTYPEKGGVGGVWGMPTDAPHGYREPTNNEYSDYDDTQHYIPPPNLPAAHTPAWTAPSYAGPGYPGWTPTPTPSAGYPVFTPQPQFGPGPSYPTTPMAYPPFYPAPYGFQGPGYTMNYPGPAGGWPGNQGGPSGGLDPAKEENNNQNDSGNQSGNNEWGGPSNGDKNNGNTGNKDTNATNWDNNGDNNNQPSGDNTGTTNWGDPQPEDQQQGQTGDNTENWPDNANNTNNDQQQQTDQGWGDNGQTNDQQAQGNWDNSGQNNQTQGNWDNSGQINQTQGQGNWDNNNANDTIQPQQPQQDQSATGAPQLNPRSTRPLYGPYGAYYTSHACTTSLSGPAAEAEEEPPFDVPETIAADKGTTHQVQPGKGYLYVHKRASPEYLDGIEEPYARFVFKYRTKEQIEREIGVAIEHSPTGDEEKRKFTDKTPDELIELLIRAQNALGGKIPSPPPPPPPPAAGEELAPIPAPTAYKYLKYELPKGRNAGLGISGGGNNAPQTQQQSAQQGGGGAAAADWQMSSAGPAGGWGAPPGQQQQTQTQQSAPNWQTAVESGSQIQGGGNSNWQNANATNHSSPADGGWGAAPMTGGAGAGGGGQEAPAGGSGW